MLLALALLVIGGTVLFTGPVQAVIVNFNLVGETTTTMDSLLCPNRIYTFSCEATGTSLVLRSFTSSDSVIDFFSGSPGHSISLKEFDFAAMSSMTGIIATAVVDSSTGLMSARLECSGPGGVNATSLSTVVKYPLDAPNPDSVHVTCVAYGSSDTFIEVTWEAVDCAQSYVLIIFAIDNITTSDISHQASYNVFKTNISGSVSAVDGSSLPFFEECVVLFSSTPTTPLVHTDPSPTVRPAVPGFKTNSVYDPSCCGKTETGYNISFIDLPAGATAYYETSDGGNIVDIDIANGVATIFFESTVTVYVSYANGTVYSSEELEAPTVSGRDFCCLWLILTIVLVFGILFGIVCAIAIKIIVKKCCEGPKVASQGNIAPDKGEMKEL